MSEVSLQIGEIKVSLKDDGYRAEECVKIAEATLKALIEVNNAGTRQDDKTCLYAGQEYSPGSVVDMPGGAKSCSSDGHWR